MEAKHIAALDVGAKRIGVAMCDVRTRIPLPFGIIDQDDGDALDQVEQLLKQQAIVSLVVGLPRGLDGQETAQTRIIREFYEKLSERVVIPVYLQDEAATSVQAEEELKERGKPYAKGDIDALAATYILEDYLGEYPEQAHV